jgi:quinoprotein glucose dehydrogenase
LRYFASKQINKSNVTQLQVAWTYPNSDSGGYPIVVRGVVYGRGRNGSLVAVNAQTGKEIWIRGNMNGMATRGVMYWESGDGRNQRIIFPMNSLLQELDAKTGKSILSFGANGVVDLRVGGDSQVRAWDSETGKQLWSSRFGGSFLGSLVMYEMGGRQYLLVPAASSADGRGRGGPAPAAPDGAAAPSAPLGWVAYALPAK